MARGIDFPMGDKVQPAIQRRWCDLSVLQGRRPGCREGEINYETLKEGQKNREIDLRGEVEAVIHGTL